MPCASFKLLVRSKLGNEKTFNKFTVLYKNNNFTFVREKYSYSWFHFVSYPNLQIENMNVLSLFFKLIN